ncbi:1, 4-beta cellobiohydrolase [Podospora conica]|nr:1, 4-beta cellobiohydrolase [Schizothecium conicum]
MGGNLHPFLHWGATGPPGDGGSTEAAAQRPRIRRRRQTHRLGQPVLPAPAPAPVSRSSPSPRSFVDTTATMRATTALIAALSAAGAVSALPADDSSKLILHPLQPGKPAEPTKPTKPTKPGKDASVNPFEGKVHYVNPVWADKLDQTYKAFIKQKDWANAKRVRKVQAVSTFVWVSRLSELANIDAAIATARREQRLTGKKQIVGLVLYNLPDRDCSAGESAGELDSTQNGLQRYKDEFLAPYVAKVSAAPDLEFAIVLEPDSLGNLVTNMAVPLCARAAPIYTEGIAMAIAALQQDNVHLYIDAAHGGWLGWADNLPLAAAEFGKAVNRAKEISGSNSTTIRGFSTNVSNYNPFSAAVRENYTEWSPSWDESHYATSLAPFLEAEGLPARFIIDQGRVHKPNAREEWGEWCNVSPAGFGQVPTTKTDNPYVDSLVWIKPGGESDGQCGFEGAPRAGAWHDEYAQHLTKNADPSVDKVKISIWDIILGWLF